jgi:ribulose 1,5-bisphosphate synthetase/thiazole synthase
MKRSLVGILATYPRARAGSHETSAIAIGAGDNTLVAANLLAERGWSVPV